MPSCCVCHRARTSSTKLLDITFHKFPSDQTVREKWLNFAIENSLTVNNITKQSLLCSSHFDASLFIVHKNTRRLSKNAVPHIKITRVKSSKNVYPEISEVGQSSPVPFNLDVERNLVKLPTNEIESGQSVTSVEELSPLDVSMLSNHRFSPSSSTHLSAEKCITIIAENISCEGVSPFPSNQVDPQQLDISILSKTSCNHSTIQKDIKSSYLAAASSVSDKDTPKRLFLKRGVRKLFGEIEIKNQKLKVLQQNLRRANKKIASLKSIIVYFVFLLIKPSIL